MTYDLVQKIENGEMPGDAYLVASTKEELAEIVREYAGRGGHVIEADCTEDFLFAFGLPIDGKGKVACANDEFLGEDERPNPAYRRMTFDSAEAAVDGFKVGGVSVWPWAKGRRFAIGDIPMCVWLR